MKNLLLLASLGVLGYFGYHRWSADKGNPAAFFVQKPAVEAPTPTPAPTDPWLRGKVARLFEEWKRRNASTDKKQHVYLLDMAEVLSEIKMRGPYTDQVIASKFTKILIEMGVSPDEAGMVAAGILKEAARDGTMGGHDGTSFAREDKRGGGSAP
jgi:hypothetical protein